MPARSGYSTGYQFVRVSDLFDRLASTRRGLTTQEIVGAFEVNARSARRYIRQLRDDVGLDIESVDGRYRLDEGRAEGHDEVVLPFTPEAAPRLRAYGRHLVLHGDARVEDLVGRWRGGDTLAEIAAAFAVPPERGDGRVCARTRAASDGAQHQPEPAPDLLAAQKSVRPHLIRGGPAVPLPPTLHQALILSQGRVPI